MMSDNGRKNGSIMMDAGAADEVVEGLGAGNIETTTTGGGGGEDVTDSPSDCEKQQNNDNSPSILSKARFEDHFSLMYPSSSVRFRGSNVRIYEQRTTQVRLEEKPDDVVLVKRIKNDVTIGLNFLRFAYTIVCLFFCCFLFIFCFQVLLFLFMDLVAELGIVQNLSIDVPAFLGTLFATPVFVMGLASAMTMAGTFLVDTWQGHTFLRSMLQWETTVLTEWIAFAVFLGVPMCTMIGTLMAQRDDWWEVTSLTWFYCVFAYYCCFVIAVIYYEIDSAVFILRKLNPDSNWKVLFRRAVMTRQNFQFSGVKRTVRMVNKQSEDQTVGRERVDLYSRITRMSCCRLLFKTLDTPQQLRSTSDMLGESRFVTAHTWSLEKIFCWNHNAQTIAVVKGPFALHVSQMRSSFICAILGNLLIFLVLLAAVVWVGGSTLFIGLMVLVLVCCIFPHIRASVRFYDMYRALSRGDKKHSDDEVNPGEEDEQELVQQILEEGTVYQKWETKYITRPRVRFCWVMFVLEIALLYMWPLITLILVKNMPIAVLFLGTGIITGVRHYLNLALLLKEVGSLDVLGERVDADILSEDSSEKVWSQQSRLSTILSNITTGRVRRAWTWIFAALAFFVLVFAVDSFGTTQEESASNAEVMKLLPVDGFKYEPQAGLHYPTCRLAKGLEIPESNSTGLQDYAFIAATAYQSHLTVQQTIDAWFGVDLATVEFDIVRNFRTGVEGVRGGDASISYRFVTFPNKFGVVVVRGSTNAW